MLTTRTYNYVWTIILSLTGAPLVAGAATSDAKGVQVYGFVQGDFIYDFDRVDPDWNATLRPSKIPVNCPGDPGCGSDGETIFSVRQTRLGFKGDVPTDAGPVKILLEFDLFGVGGGAGQTDFRLRHAYAEFGAFGAGQTWTLLKDGDASPTTLDFWGPIGMFSSRKVQLRWTPYQQDDSKLAVALEATGSSLDEGNVTDVFPDLNVSSKVGVPDLTAQYHAKTSWGHWQAAGIVRQIEFEDVASGASGDEMGYGASLSGSLNLGEKDKLQAQLAYGRGVASYFNDCCVDIGPDENLEAEAVPLTGWLLYYDHAWTAQWRSVVGYSAAIQDNTANQTADAMHKGTYTSASLLYSPAKKILMGGELLWGERENNDGASGDDMRVQFSAKYEF
jgi:hypothetical protein